MYAITILFIRLALGSWTAATFPALSVTPPQCAAQSNPLQRPRRPTRRDRPCSRLWTQWRAAQSHKIGRSSCSDLLLATRAIRSTRTASRSPSMAPTAARCSKRRATWRGVRLDSTAGPTRQRSRRERIQLHARVCSIHGVCGLVDASVAVSALDSLPQASEPDSTVQHGSPISLIRMLLELVLALARKLIGP